MISSGLKIVIKVEQRKKGVTRNEELMERELFRKACALVPAALV